MPPKDAHTYSNHLLLLFTRTFGYEPSAVSPLAQSGSQRRYYRMLGQGQSVIGSINPDHRDHQAFIFLTRHFMDRRLPVPALIANDPQHGVCLLQDAGDQSLFSSLTSKPNNRSESDIAAQYYEAIRQLSRFQIDGAIGLDFNKLPIPEFDRHGMMWDMNYFKYCFLKPSSIYFEEGALENDFETLIKFATQDTPVGFMYRDFQARNVMIQAGQFLFIDYQGGRRGPLLYDIVSLLYQVSAQLSQNLRAELFDNYAAIIEEKLGYDKNKLHSQLPVFVLLRQLQVMGAYGYRGWFERKPHFLESINNLKPNISWLLAQKRLMSQLPEIKRIITDITYQDMSGTQTEVQGLTIELNSFSYRRGIPYDASGNGGGFVFDCRLLPNPGLLEEYKALTGRDTDVADYLETQPETSSFLDSVKLILLQALKSYHQKGYSHLQLNFGCTGGRHRSVYCAEAIAMWLNNQPGVRVVVKHQELSKGQ